MSAQISRRQMLRATGAAAATALLSACGATATSTPAPTATARIVKETVVVKETSVVEKAVTQVVEKVVTATPAPTAVPTKATGPVTIRVWGYGLDDTRAKARLTAFKAAVKNIEVQPVGGALNTQQLLTAVASGDPPEVVSVDRSQTGSWAGRNAIDPIDDLVTRDKFDLAQFYPFTVEQVKYKGKTYGVPQFVTLDLIYMNLDVLKEVGIDPDSIDAGNWDQIQQIGEKIYKKDGAKVTRTGFDTKMQNGRLWLWTWADGGNLMSADGEKATFNDAKAVETLTWAKAVVDKQGGDLARATFQQTQNFFSAQNPVLIGQTAITVFESWLIGTLKVDPKANFRTILPRKRNTKESITEATGNAFCGPKGVKGDKREAAWSFIKGMCSTEAWLAGEKATFEANTTAKTPYTPTMTGNIKADTEIFANIYKSIGPSYDQTVKLLPEALKVAKTRYAGPVASQVNDLLTASVNDALLGAKTPQAALDELTKSVQAAIDDYKKGAGNS